MIGSLPELTVTLATFTGLSTTDTAVAALLVPLIGTVLIGLLGRWPNLREGATLLTAGALFTLVASLYEPVVAGESIQVTLFYVLPRIPLAFNIEPLGLIYALLGSFLWILNSIYSIGYMRANGEKHQTLYYMCFATALMSVIGIAFAGNLFTMFTFYEVLSLCTFPLVTHKRTPEAMKAGRVYLGVLLGSSVLLQLGAILWTYALVTPHGGTLDFQAGGLLAAAHNVAPALLGVLYALYVFGIAKCAIMPLHKWLPAAMVAPTPVSALLHAVAVVKAGVFCVLKVTIYVFGVDRLASIGSADWLVYVAGFTIVAASMVALYQDNLKRRLAYSTISQLSYIVLAAALFSPIAVMAAAFHIVAHGFGKITLFFAAGSIYTAAHKTEISQLDGIGRRMPWTMGAFTIGTLSMIGIPPTAGFVSKIWLLGGTWDSQHGFALGVIILSTLLNAAYFLPIVWRAFFRPPPALQPGEHAHGEAPWPIVAALTLTALGTVAFFVWPDLIVLLADRLVEFGVGASPIGSAQ